MSDSAIALLKRESRRDETIVDFMGDFPEQVEDKLGYSPLVDEQSSNQLRDALHSAGCPAFTAESVEKYKQRMVEETNSPIRATIDAAIWGTSIVLFLLSFSPAFLGWIISWKIGVAGITGVVLSGYCYFRFQAGIELARAHWEYEDLSDYNEPVPDWALGNALRIKEQLPDVEFLIHTLKVRSRTVDPFISALHNGQELYFDVWQEPGYEAEREA